MKAIAVFATLGALGVGFADWAHAKGGTGSHPGSAHPGGAHPGGVHVGGAHAGHPGYAHQPGNAPHYYGGGSGSFFPGYGNTYGLYNYGPGYNYGYNYGIVNGPTYPSNLTSTYRLYPPDSALLFGVTSVPSAPVKDGKATLQVVAPTADAEVLIEGNKTTNVGRERLFTTPILEAGYRYVYTVTATWTQDGKSMRDARTVEVAPYRVSVIDFTRPAAPDPVAPPPKVDPNQS